MPGLLIFAVLCAWEASQWLLPKLALDPLPFAWISATAFAVVAIAGALRRGDRSDTGGWVTGLRLGALGALALGVPSMLLAVAQRYFAAEVAAAALAGVPIVIVVTAQVTLATEGGSGEALLPAIAGLGGALLLIPVRLPASSNGWIGFSLDLGAVLLAGIFGVLAHRAAQGVAAATAVQRVASGNAVVLMVLAGVLRVLRIARLETYAMPSISTSAAALGIGVLTALAAIVLLCGMRPLGFASRFLIVPLLGAIEGFVLLRPTLSVRAFAGAALMAVAGGVLLRPSPVAVGSVVPVRSRG